MHLPPMRPAETPPPSGSRWVRAACLWAVVALAHATATAQLTVHNAEHAPYDPEALIREVFLGSGVEVLGIEFAGERVSLGYFEDGAAAVGIDRGLVLTTGYAASGGGNAGVDATSDRNAQFDNNSAVRDPNLERLAPYINPVDTSVNIHNVARYRITFRPKGDRVSFRYAFASEEYPQFVCSEFNDLFGFFISGPGFAGPYANGAENIAIVPGTNLPVAINTINGGIVGDNGDVVNCAAPDGSLANAAYYRDNSTPGQYPVYNGLTRVLTAEAAVVPCQEYTIEITIGDIRDPAYDSGVFLEAESFETSSLDVVVEAPALGNEIAEGCTPGRFTFTFNEVAAVDRTVAFTTSGTATSGEDYVPIPSTATVPAGQRSVSVTVEAIADGLVESPETVTVTVELDPCTTRELTLVITDPKMVPVPPLADTTICPGAPVPLDATLPLSLDNPKSFENTERVRTVRANEPAVREIEVVGVDPDRLTAAALTEVCVDINHPNANSLELFLFTPAGRSLELTTDNGGGRTVGQVCFRPDAPVAIDDPAAPFPWVGDYRPEGAWTDLVGADDPVNGTWRLQVTKNENGGIGTILGWSMTFAARYELDYAWSPSTGLSCVDCPATVASPTTTTDYTVTATDSYGCVETGNVEIATFPPTTPPAVGCAPGFDHLAFSWPADPLVGAYAVSTDGGATWTSVGTRTDTTFTGLGVAESITLLVRATGPCGEATGSSSCVTQDCPAIGVTATSTPASCGGYADGAVDASAGGGVAPYAYTLDGQTNADGRFDGLLAGDYVVTVRDANNCQVTADVTVTEPTLITTGVTVDASTACDQPATATASAGDGAGGPFTFAWSDGQSGAVASFSESGTYYVDVTDAAGCRRRDSAVIAMPPPLVVAFAVDSATCHDRPDGAIRAIVSGGSPGYRYDFGSGYQAAASATGLTAGQTYVVGVRDQRGCGRDTTVTVPAPPPLELEVRVSDVACHGQPTGAAGVVVRGARGEVTVTWPGLNVENDSVGGLAAGSYAVYATDGRGCRVEGTAVVAEPEPLSASAAVDSLSCAGGADGRVRVDVSGGTAPYTYRLGDRASRSTNEFADLPAGVYEVAVTDALGCETRLVARVAGPAPLSASHRIVPVRCAGGVNGQIALTITGGRRPYTYAWDDGATTRDRVGVRAGDYRVVVTDASGCTLPYEVTVGSPAAIDFRAEANDVSCYGYNDGSIAVAPVGGRPPYTYQWDGPGGYAFFGARPGQLAAGAYRLRLADQNGCPRDTTFVIEQPAQIALATTTVDTICHAAANGSAVVVVTGGTAPFDYAWDNGERGDTARALTAGVAVVTVTDANACVFTDSTEVHALEALTLALTQVGVDCYRDSNGVASVATAAYGTRLRPLAGLTFRWRGYPDSARATMTARGGSEELVVEAEDERGCLAVDSVVIAEPPPRLAAVRLLSDVTCHGRADGVAEVVASGGTGALAYAWLSDGSTDARNDALPAGTSAVRTVDENGCADTTAVSVRQPDRLLARVDVTEVDCFDPRSGAVAVVLTGGNVP